MRAHAIAAVLLCAVACLAAGCGSDGGRGAGGAGHAVARDYERALAVAQARLAAAERAVPSRPRSATALAASVRRLAGAVGAFHGDLARIAPPPAIRGEHERLVTVAAGLQRDLLAVAAEAVRPGRLAAASSRLVATTVAAGGTFDGAVAVIRRRLSS